jgi:hypothetical protein
LELQKALTLPHFAIEANRVYQQKEKETGAVIYSSAAQSVS